MKFLHLADLHIGKKLNEYPLYDDQRFVLDQALALAKSEKVDAILIAGDIYDSSAPSAEAMESYDELLNKLFDLSIPVILIAGNHDSPERLAVASRILAKQNIHIVTKLQDALTPIIIQGVNVYALSFLRPSEVNRAFNTDCRSVESALKEVLQRMNIDSSKANVLLTHQAILPLGNSVQASGSETALDIDSSGSVGGGAIVDVSLFSAFDYLALGHIHKAQNVAKNARFAGALLKYHVKEASAKRSFTIVDLNGKDLAIHEFPVTLKHDLIILTGTLEELLAHEGNEHDYIQARLTDNAIVDAPHAKLKAKFEHLLGLEYVRQGDSHIERVDFEHVEEVDRNVLFATFYQEYGKRELDEREKSFVKSLWEEEEDA